MGGNDVNDGLDMLFCLGRVCSDEPQFRDGDDSVVFGFIGNFLLLFLHLRVYLFAKYYQIYILNIKYDLINSLIS